MLIVVSVLMQVGLPFIASEIGKESPEVEWLVVPYSITEILTVTCMQVTVIGIWSIITQIKNGNFYSAATLHGIEIIRIAVTTAPAIPVVICVHLIFL